MGLKTEKMEWIRVEDDMPDDDSDVLVCDSEYSSSMQADYNSKYFGLKGFWLYENGGEYCTEFTQVTHWMYMPALPKK
ncbi:MAG: DUF551 domain-containing protein [Nanoarchaeota archaeon]|nr:DUF551 domain-containing protein [Nanoarchaeota archaeon]